MPCGGCSKKRKKIVEKSTQMVQKSTNIVEGWANLMTKRYKHTPFVKNRAQICYKCSNLNKVTKFCKLCGCFIPAKITVKKEGCPVGLWTKVR